MTKSKRFEPIQEIAANSAKELSRTLADAVRKVNEQEQQLQQLQSYRDEYVRNSSQSNGTMDAVKLQNYRSFLSRLGEALRQQTKSLDNARVEYERRRTLWSQKRIEAESLSRVVDRFRKEELHAAERREQHEGDEAAMRISAGSRPESGNV